MDWNSAEGQKLAERLRKEIVIWLTTVSPNGLPIPTPVWFLWDGETVVIYSQPGTVKLRNIATNSKAALNLNSDEWGGDIAVFTGELHIEKNGPPATQNQAYIEKYREAIKDIQMTPESFAQSYNVPLRFTIKHTRVE